MKRNNKILYLLVLVLMSATVVIALGGGVFGQSQPWFIQWQHQAFAQLCHQMPDRSFWIGGQPMAVCSRCLGVYTGFVGIWILAPAFYLMREKILSVNNNVLLAAVGLNVVDALGNMAGFWQNTLASRLVLGAFIGLSVAAFLTGYLFTTTKKREEYHGTVTITNAGI